MALLAGTRLGNYDIVGPLGAGGMGEVYRGRDPNLKREVAIKVLPETFARDPERCARLRREAEVLASLTHPHIAAIYDLVDSGPSPFLVLELVEGETLAERIARGLLGRDEVLSIARQIAAALEAAHDKGIIHRDLKPANVKLTADGQVKVLDFGLAKLHDGVDGDDHRSDVSTMLSTTPGLVVGTAAYMSPEQANGAPATRSSDMWAFGCVLYEMLAGSRPFDGSTMSEVLANVLKSEPDWQRLPADTPQPIRRLLRRSLQKDPKVRARDMRDARLQIEEAWASPAEPERASPRRTPRRERLAWGSALAVVALIAALAAARALKPAPVPEEVRFEINTPPSRTASLAVSPDGRQIVFVGRSEGRSRLWLRSLDSTAMKALTGTDRASSPFWSPDGRSIGFFAEGKIKRMDVNGGPLQVLASAEAPLGGAWGRDGTILFGTNPGGRIHRVSAAGGDARPVTRIGSAEQRGHAWPAFLPDGRHFLFYSIGSPEARGVYLGQLDDLNSTRLLSADGPAVVAASGHLLFVRDGKLLAQEFNAGTLTMTGDPFSVAEVAAGTVVSTSAGGSIAYQTPPADRGQRQLVWMDRAGRETAKVIYADAAALGPALSPDHRRIGVFREANGNMDIWSYETTRKAWDRITFNLGDDIFPLWSPDGTSIAYGAVRTREGVVDLYLRRLSAAQGSEDLLLATSAPKFPSDWSSDGRYILFDSIDPKGGWDIWMVPLAGNHVPVEVVRTDFNEGLAQFSPDGRWIAYQSDRSGRREIYVRPFPGGGDDRLVSIDGGSQVRWSPDGKELFYIGGDDRLMAVPIGASPTSKVVEPGVPHALFPTNVGSAVTLAYRQQYVVSADGQSFVFNSAVGDSSASPITVILNWRVGRR